MRRVHTARRTRFAPVTLYRKRICTPGALDDGELDMGFHEKITGDGEVMEWFLQRQVIHLKKWVVTIPRQCLGALHSRRQEPGGRMRGPPGPRVPAAACAELNSIEIRWLVIRKAIADVVFSITAALKRPYEGAVSSDALIVAIAACARDGGAPVPRSCTVRVGNEIRCPSR